MAIDWIVLFRSCSCDMLLLENLPSKMTDAGTPMAAAMWSLTTRMRSTRSERASGGRTPGTTCCRSGQANKLGGSGGGTCAGTDELPVGRAPAMSVVCNRLMVAIILA